MNAQPKFHPGDVVKFCEYFRLPDLAPTAKLIVGRVLRSWSSQTGTTHIIVHGAQWVQRDDRELSR